MADNSGGSIFIDFEQIISDSGIISVVNQNTCSTQGRTNNVSISPGCGYESGSSFQSTQASVHNRRTPDLVCVASDDIAGPVPSSLKNQICRGE